MGPTPECLDVDDLRAAAARGLPMQHSKASVRPTMHSRAEPKGRRSAAIMATCRRFHDNARPQLYSKTAFHFPAISMALAFFKIWRVSNPSTDPIRSLDP